MLKSIFPQSPKCLVIGYCANYLTLHPARGFSYIKLCVVVMHCKVEVLNSVIYSSICMYIFKIIIIIIWGDICMSFSLKVFVNAKCLGFLFISHPEHNITGFSIKCLSVWERSWNMRDGWNMQWQRNGTFAAVLKMWQIRNVIQLTTKTDSGVIIASGMQSSGVVLWYSPFWTSMPSCVT